MPLDGVLRCFHLQPKNLEAGGLWPANRSIWSRLLQPGRGEGRRGSEGVTGAELAHIYKLHPKSCAVQTAQEQAGVLSIRALPQVGHAMGLAS